MDQDKTDIRYLPVGVARCFGRTTLDPNERACTLRDTCRRYQAMLLAEPGPPMPLLMLTDENGECQYYMEASDD